MDTRYIRCVERGDDGDIESVGYSTTMHGEVVGKKTKQEVVDDILRGDDYETAVRKTEEWRTEEVHVQDGDRLRVDGDGSGDDLGGLPDCSSIE